MLRRIAVTALALALPAAALWAAGDGAVVRVVKTYETKTKGDWTVYTNANEIRDIAVTPDRRYVWSATGGGVTRFDVSEETFTKYTTLDGLRDSATTEIEIDEAGRVWVDTLSGPCVFAGGTWRATETFEPMPRRRTEISYAVEGAGGKPVWISWKPTGGGLEVTTDGEKKVLRTQDTLDSNMIWGGGQDADGRMWFATWARSNYVFKLVDGEFVKTVGGPACGIGVDRDGQMKHPKTGHYWFAMQRCRPLDGPDKGKNVGKGIVEFDGERWKNMTREIGLGGGSPDQVRYDLDGNVWVSTHGGLWSWDGEKVTKYNDQMPVTKSLSNYPSRKKGIVWVATDGGPSRVEDGKFHCWTIDGLASRTPEGVKIVEAEKIPFVGYRDHGDKKWYDYRPVAEDGNGWVWYGSSQGLDAWTGEKWLHFRPVSQRPTDNFDQEVWAKSTDPKVLSHGYVEFLWPDHTQGTWFATLRGGISAFDGRPDAQGKIDPADFSRWHHFHTADGLVSEAGWFVMVDKDNTKWFGTVGGISKYTGPITAGASPKPQEKK